MQHYRAKVHQYRQQLEKLAPPTGLGKWQTILEHFRVAGRPRSVTVCEKIAIVDGLLADRKVPEAIKPEIRTARERLLLSPAYAERIWLDQQALERYLLAFISNDYQAPWHQLWGEDRSLPLQMSD